MSVYARPINEQDVRDIATGRVKTVSPYNMTNPLPNSVVDKKLFGLTPEHHMKKEMTFDDEFNRTAVIHLTVPILNPFLAGSKAEIWSKVLPMYDIEGIMWGRVAMNLETGEFVKRESIKSVYSEKWCYGGTLLRKLAKEDNTEERLKKQLFKTFVLPLIKDRVEGVEIVGEVKYVSDEELTDGTSIDVGWLCDNYVWIAPEGFEDVYEKLPEIAPVQACDIFTNPNSSLTYLLAFNKDKDKFIEQVMDDVFVLPYGFRPTVDGRTDPITVQYNQLVKLNNELMESISFIGCSMESALVKYERLVRQLCFVFVGNKELERFAPDNYKCLTDRLSGKKGLIRDKMQGVRIDYSGRAVITSNPWMPIDCIGIPKAMLGTLAEQDIIQSMKEDGKQDKNMSYMMTSRHTKQMIEKGIECSTDEYYITGRQPTLFYLGLQGFRVIPVDGNAIILSPLVVMPFNADFDGDHMHVEKAVSPQAKQEVKKLMASTENLFYPKNGAITVEPRHEIIYGLWICSCKKDHPNKRVWDEVSIINEAKSRNKFSESFPEMVYNLVVNQVISVYDVINVASSYAPNLNGKTAGIWAIKYVVGKSNAKYVIGKLPLTIDDGSINDEAVSVAWFKEILKVTGVANRQNFIVMVNKMVQLGFAIANIWPPSISVINNLDTSKFIEEFNRKILAREEYLNKGIEIESTFTEYFNTEYSKLQDKLSEYVVSELGMASGYVSMWKSGAKGSKSNVLQLFGTKGRIMKDDVTAFNTIISNSLANQLNGLEHLITGYGSRQGIADKVLATAEPGYLTRQLEHAAANYIITTDDCGTDEGIVWTYDDAIQFVDPDKISDNMAMNLMQVEEHLVPLIVGRVILPTNTYINNAAEAKQAIHTYVANMENGEFVLKDGIEVRSPLKCKCPVCRKCYGKDLTSGAKYPKVGKAVGFIAAQAIGEPGTQLTMKNFQRGGVASAANLTSSFKKIDKYFHLTSLYNSKDKVLAYDALSPKEGYVKSVSTGDGRKQVIVTKDESSLKNTLGIRKYYVDEHTRLKSYVCVGDSFQEIQGDLDIRECIKYRGIDTACKYLILMLHSIFNAETELNAKHFEVIVASMLGFILVKSAGPYQTGECLSTIEFNDVSSRYPLFGKWTLLGLKELPKMRTDFFESLMMENMKTFVRRSAIMHPVDSMINPKTRLSFGLNINVGSDYQDYLEY